MKLLLDTHVLVWWFSDDPSLPEQFGSLLDQTVEGGESVAASAISIWEVAMLASRGRLIFSASIDAFLDEVERHPAVEIMPLTGPISVESTRLGPSFPRDPADRIIAATARCHALRLMTADRRIRESGAVALADP